MPMIVNERASDNYSFQGVLITSTWLSDWNAFLVPEVQNVSNPLQRSHLVYLHQRLIARQPLIERRTLCFAHVVQCQFFEMLQDRGFDPL
jgi:hypothetical protein